MQRTVKVLVAMAVVLGGARAGAADIPLTAGKLAKLADKAGTSTDQAIVKFIKDPVLQGVLPGPLCPVASSVHLRTDGADLVVPLDCAKWTITGSGYAYKDPTGAQGGVQKVQISTKSTGGKLMIKMKGDNYGAAALAGPVTFLEASLTIGATGWCGRFESPTSTFTKNLAASVKAKGPSLACIPPPTATPTITSTATITLTPSVTRTVTNSPTASQTRTPSNTATVTQTGTATWTPTNTFTASPTPTASATRTITDTPTITPTATVTWTGQATATETATFTITSSPTVTPIPATVFRIDSIALRDPHVYVTVIGCTDVTNNFLGQSVNEQIAAKINADSEPDGLMDISILALFRPLVQPPSAGAFLELTTGDCTTPLGSESCSPGTGTPGSTTYSNQASGTCLSPIAGTTGPGNVGNFSPTMTLSSGPCFSTTPVDVSFPFGLFTIPLEGVRGSGTYVGDPASQLINGLLVGFLSEAAANMILLPDGLPLGLSNQPLSKFLPGGSGSCQGTSAKDIGPMSQTGWYFYFNYTAHAVTWTGP